jgi:hypothetical protein
MNAHVRHIYEKLHGYSASVAAAEAVWERLLERQREPEALAPADAGALACLWADPEVEALNDLSCSYVRMIQEKRAGEFDGWLDACGWCGVGPLVSLWLGLRRDYVAVRAALEEPWSGGQAEGQINRLKTLKRKMYGWAGFELLRRRVLCAA